jgi:hypothetical protein
MEEITRSRNPMILLVGAAGAFAIGSVFRVIAYAIFTAASRGNINTYTDLNHVSDWFHFVGVLAAFAAVGLTGWDLLPKRRLTELIEVGGATLATLLITIGSLVEAASTSSDSAANVIVAVGIGGWALLAFSRAARYNVAEQASPTGAPSMVPLWLAVSGALLIFAIGASLTVKVTDQGLGIAAGLLEAIGLLLLAQTILRARARRMLMTEPVPAVIVGLGVLVIGFLVYTVAAGIAFTPSSTLTQLRVGLALTNFILAVGTATLGWAAWIRVTELVAGHPRQPGRGEGWTFRRWPSSATVSAPQPGAPAGQEETPAPAEAWAPPVPGTVSADDTAVELPAAAPSEETTVERPTPPPSGDTTDESPAPAPEETPVAENRPAPPPSGPPRVITPPPPPPPAPPGRSPSAPGH